MLYNRPIEKITWNDLKEFCEQRLPESAYLDYKENFPKNLHKTISAFANTLGGIIIIGVEEDKENKPVLPLKGIEFQRGLSERIINIILSNITPPVFPEIQVCLNSDKNKAVVLVRIHASEQAPHAIAENTQVYYRTGNRNNPESQADIDRIQWLLNKRQKSEELRQRLYMEADVRFKRLYGRYSSEFVGDGESTMMNGLFTLSLCPLYPKDYFRIPPELNQVATEIFVKDDYGTNHEFPIARRRKGLIVKNGIVLSFFGRDMVFYTELNAFGLYFYRQILQWNYSPDGQQHLKTINLYEILARLDEFIDSGILFYKEIGYAGPLRFSMHLDGILDYPLVIYPRLEQSLSLEDQVQFSETILGGNLEDSKIDLIYGVVQRLGWAFGINISNDLLKRFYTKYKR